MISPYYPDGTAKAYQDRRAFRLGGVAFLVVTCAVAVGSVLTWADVWYAALIAGGLAASVGLAAAEVVYERYRPH